MAFSREKNLKAWAKTGLSPFTQRVWWELQDKEARVKDRREQIQNGITKIDWAAVAGVRNADGQNVSAEQLNEGITRGRGRGINSSQFWGSFRGMEELHAAQGERQAEMDQNQAERQQRTEQRDARKAEAIQNAKGLLDELFTFIIEDGGRWRFKSKEARTGAKITKAHLEAVFIATGQKIPESRLDLLLPAAQEVTKWDSDSFRFRSRLLWNDDRKTWWFFGEQ
jgi:hypothetical protein